MDQHHDGHIDHPDWMDAFPASMQQAPTHAGHRHEAVATNVSAHNRGFCMTPPTFMYGTGLTLLPSSRENPCFVFLYPSFVVDSWKKYALAVVAAFLLGLLCEVLRWSRTCLRRRRPPLLKTSSTPLAVFTCCEALLFMAHVTTTYAVMLLVMSMEGMMVVGCITGLAVGYCATETMLVLMMRQQALSNGSEAEQLRIESSETLSLSDACCSISSVEEGGPRKMHHEALRNKARGEAWFVRVHDMDSAVITARRCAQLSAL